MAEPNKGTQTTGTTTGSTSGTSASGSSTGVGSGMSGAASAGQHTTGQSGQGSQSTTTSGQSGAAARQARDPQAHSQMEQPREMLNQAKRTANDAYQRASETVNDTYEQALDYTRENPGKAALVMFGVGVGVGLLLANGSMMGGRNRTRRIVPPVMNAISEIASELFR